MIDLIMGFVFGALVVLAVGGLYVFFLIERKEDIILDYRLDVIELRKRIMDLRMMQENLDKDSQIEDMHAICSNVKSRKRLLTKRMEALYDAGYRKLM